MQEQEIREEKPLTIAQTYALQLAMIIKGAISHYSSANYQTMCREFISGLSENLSSVDEFDEFRTEFNRLCEHDPELNTISIKMGKGLEQINSSLDQCREVVEENTKSRCVLC